MDDLTQPKDGEGAEALLGCPFCGLRLVKDETFSNRRQDCFVHPQDDTGKDLCPAYDVRIYSGNPGRIAAWNRRAPPATPVRGGGGEGSSNASRAATRDHSLAATEAEPSAAEALAMRFHETYERLAPDFGYRTREASAKPWAEVPSHNKALMIAVCAELLGAAS